MFRGVMRIPGLTASHIFAYKYIYNYMRTQMPRHFFLDAFSTTIGAFCPEQVKKQNAYVYVCMYVF